MELSDIYIVSAETDLKPQFAGKEVEWRYYEEVLAPVNSYEEAEKVIAESQEYANHKGFHCFFVCCYKVGPKEPYLNIIRWRRYDKDGNILTEQEVE